MYHQRGILHLARSKESDKVFNIGIQDQYGISISDQQAKALSLAWALIESRKVTKNTKVAVIGGGFSGTTVALALAVKKNCLVTLFEKEDHICSVASSAVWRWIVPFNDYLNDGYYSDRTHFPFLNWEADFGWKVVRQFQRKWDLYSKSYKIKTKYKTHVEITSADLKPTIVANGKKKKFDIVILATGFGEESSPRQSVIKTYWESGDPKDYRKLDFTKPVIVSGTGDGGLLECFHLVFNDFYQDEIVSRYYDPRLSGQTLKYVMDSLNKYYYKKWDFFTIHHNGKTSTDKQLEKLRREYNMFFKSVANNKQHKDFLRYLKSKLVKGRTIYLNGKSIYPFDIERHANPFNLVLLSYLLKLGAVKYLQGECKTNGKQGVIIGPEKAIRVPLSQIIFRHGNKKSLKRDFPVLTFVSSIQVKKEFDVFDSLTFDHGFLTWNDLVRRNDYLKKYFVTKKIKKIMRDNGLIQDELGMLEAMSDTITKK